MADYVENLPESVTVSEALTEVFGAVQTGPESVAVSEDLSIGQAQTAVVAETVTVSEGIQTGSLEVEALDGQTVRASFPEELRLVGFDLVNFSIRPLLGAAPVSLSDLQLHMDVVQTGSSGRVVDLANPTGLSDQFSVTGTVTPGHIGDYLEILNGSNAGVYRIRGVPSSTVVQVEGGLVVGDSVNGYVSGQATVLDAGLKTLRLDTPEVTPGDPIVVVTRVENRTTGTTLLAPSVTIQDYRTVQVLDGGFPVSAGDRIVLHVRVTAKTIWRHVSAVKAATLKVFPKLTRDVDYVLETRNFRSKLANAPVRYAAQFRTAPSAVDRPRVVSATFLPEEGSVRVVFNQPMRIEDGHLANPADYTVTGPSTVNVKQVVVVNPTTVVLKTTGFAAGDYTLTISSSTPKDVAGNPLDPSFNSLIFTAAVPQLHRSLFTDKGPIAKPPLTLQSGVNATLNTFNEVTLTGATLTAGLIGQMVRLTGSANAGTFRISSIVSTTRARLANASFTLPDVANGTLGWTIFDPRDGQIADDPSDVVVRINGTPVVPEAVVGLLGQVLLPSVPDPADDVKIDYSWVLNPTVDIRRLNSKEFRLNAWNRDKGYAKSGTQHHYRYNNVLVRPSDYVPDDMSAKLAQPKLRELHYRAFERAYTPVLNDPTLLLLNSPTHRIAYPSAKRELAEASVNYEALTLPELDATAPWLRKGSGTASTMLGQLTITDNSSGAYPSGTPIFWTRAVDVTFPHVFAMSWRFLLTMPTQPDGVFTGVAAGVSTEKGVLVVGYILDGGVRKIGVLKRGFADNPSSLSAWTGGVDISGPTGSPAELDWSVLHSYRIFRGKDGVIRVYVDGDVVETLRISESELPFLEELPAPFDGIQGAFFGAVSRPARSVSAWDFVRYLIVPTNPMQTGPASYVSYEGNVVPEADAKPWTPVGYHGTSTILNSDTLLLDSTSATDQPTAADVGLMGGDFRAYARIEPLLSVASQYVVDAELQLRTQTHGVSPYGLTLAVDDGERLTQLCFFPDRAVPKFSYGGRSLPQDFAPYSWQTLGTASEAMVGRVLRITDSSIGDGRVYFVEDVAPISSDDRVVSASTDYMVEFRCRVVSYTADGAGFSGVFAQAYDSARAVGLFLQEIAGVKYVACHSDGVALGPSARFAFDWGDGAAHTYRLVKHTGGDIVSVFVDGVFLGSTAYSSFATPPVDPAGQISFGSSTPSSSAALSVVDWAYVNAWRVRSDLKKYIGIWKGYDSASLLGYHVPLKTSGRGATVVGNVLTDVSADFVAGSVATGDRLVVDAGANRGVYEVAAVVNGTTLTLTTPWPSQPSLVDYRIAKETDWTTLRKYRLAKDSTGEVSVLIGSETTPSIRIGYNSLDLPQSGVGVVRSLANGLPAMVFGSIDSENLAQSSWEYVRYGITRTVTELRIAPHHQVLNQWNVMSSPERLFTALPHEVTSFKSSSTGIVPKKDPDFLADAALPAWTQLNEGTPLVPLTQNFQTRAPFTTTTFVSALNRPEDVLNSDSDFTLNDSTIRYQMNIPKDVLYTALDVIEQTTGETDLLAPFTDECGVEFKGIQYQKEVCLTYDGTTLPENDPSAPTPWTLASDNPSQVTTTAIGGVLTYGTGGVGTRTIYRNDTPLPDHPSLQNEVTFRIRLLNDTTGGTGDSQVKFGLSAPGLTVALAFVTSPLGERLVLVFDLQNGNVLGSVAFDYLDGAYHTYRIVRDPGAGQVRISIDS